MAAGYRMSTPILLLLILHVAIAFADEPRILEPGTRIRVTYVLPSSEAGDPIRLPGELVAFTDTAIILDTYYEDSRTIRREQVIGLERSLHEYGRAEGATLGFGIGAATGILIGLASGDDKPGFFSFTAEAKAMVYGLLLAPVGTLIGFAAGSGERWENVPMDQVRLGFVQGPRGAGGLQVSVRF